MMNDFAFYWRLFLRRLPITVGIIAVCTAAGVYQALRLPGIYQTSARLLVESAQLPEDLSDSIVDVAAAEEIQIISEQLLTRANLLDIAFDQDVFENYSEIPSDQIVERMRAATSINNQGGGRNRAMTINISFRARSGQIAADVVNEYVTRVLAASVELRTGRASDALDFFERTVERLSSELDEQSARISQFQMENADALPDEQNFRLQRQASLESTIAGGQRELSALVDQRARLIEIHEVTGQVDVGVGAVNLSPEQRQLETLELELSSLLSRLAPTHPRVTELERRIDALEARIAGTAPSSSEAQPEQRTSRQAILDLQLSQLDVQIENVEAVIRDAQAALEQVNNAISRTPLNAIMLQSLERDYANIQRQYDLAVARRAQARSGQLVELDGRGQRITLIESANVPRSPTSPNRRLIAASGFMIGVVIAVGLFVFLEFLNRTVRRSADINRSLGIEPLVTVPYFITKGERRRQLVRRLGGAAAAICIVAVALFLVNAMVMPLDQVADAVLDRLRNWL
ncbi:MAG: lipopolysaccharide biosynthesis [Pseudomonadota bacterium]